MKNYIRITEADNVLVALEEVEKGQELAGIPALEKINPGHKMASREIRKGQDIIKYGYPIGQAQEDIAKGAWVHTHNIKTKLEGTLEYSYQPQKIDLKTSPSKRTFMGYRRGNGLVGIRNELLIVPTVGCINGLADSMIRRFQKEVDLGAIDDLIVYKHNYGCSQLGQDHENTKKILADIVKHPNAGGVLVLGLGCENNTIEEFKKEIGDHDGDRIKFLSSQSVENEIEEGLKLLRQLFETMKEDQREEVPISELKIGLKCGGSDGFSGITANPLLGRFSDYLIANGGSTILTEVPEMFGAETILMDRAINQEVFQKTVHLINDFKEYFISHNLPVYENPSPGNKEGGISTLEDKSLGCTQKGGEAPVVDVLAYGQPLEKKGLNLLSAPGNDLVASTALGASGCQMVLFTTGRGTPFGSFVPTMKISSNTALYKRKPHWIDFNAGRLLEGESMEEVLEDFIENIIQIASGQLVNNEKNAYKEIAIFKTGITL